MERQFNKQRTW